MTQISGQFSGDARQFSRMILFISHEIFIQIVEKILKITTTDASMLNVK